jgi:hypothetical protein
MLPREMLLLGLAWWGAFDFLSRVAASLRAAPRHEEAPEAGTASGASSEPGEGSGAG